mgnify:CR=1 FL=1
MGEILGIGLSHYPGLVQPDKGRNHQLTRALNSGRLTPEQMDPANWPEAMRAVYGEDEGLSSSRKHRERLVKGFREQRAALDAFKPDIVLIWGDDQYENFKEDIIPPFCVLAYDQVDCRPFLNKDGSAKPNAWGEPGDKVFSYQVAPAARELVNNLITQGFDISYAYKPLHFEGGLGHAFINALMFLDYDRKGFDYPIIPFQVNCYGSKVIRNQGGADQFQTQDDPPGPTPKRCMEVGAATIRAFADSPYRVALVASSSWSHAFLTDKHDRMWPDMESDRARFEEFKAGDWDAWRRLPTPQIEAAGQQEMLNWMCLAGAMEELNRKPEIVDYVETYVFNSEKCLALFQP